MDRVIAKVYSYSRYMGWTGYRFDVSYVLNRGVGYVHTVASTLRGIFQCSQKGKARFTSLNPEGGDLTSHACNLPINLRHCKASPSGSQFAYAGTEVNLSVWDTAVAFRSTPSYPAVVPPTTGKRARKGDQLFPGEIWRAKNVRIAFL